MHWHLPRDEAGELLRQQRRCCGRGLTKPAKEVPDFAATPSFPVDRDEAVAARLDVFYVESEEAEEHSQLRAAVDS